MFNSISEVYDWMFNEKKLSRRENLNRITYCAKSLGVDKPDYKIIHIAGTNGKGSTAAFLKNMLANSGCHVGFFISPFVICFNERIQINDRMISNSEIMYYANILYDFAENYKKEFNDVIPFFELTLLMALLWFKDRGIDYAVIECGLGGLLDATNFLKTDLAIITNIGYDHMAQLGNTLPEIASHKLGIVKEGMTCLSCVDDALKPQFESYAKDHHAKMIFVDQEVSDISLSDNTYFKYKNESYQTNLLASYQAYNASLAIEAYHIIFDRPSDFIVKETLKTAFWPGRMEIISKNPMIIIDGAHNIHGMSAMVDSLKLLNPEKKIKCIFTALADKAFDKMLLKLDTVIDYYYFTSIKDTRASNSDIFGNYTKKKYEVIDDYQKCIDKAKAELKEDEMLLITGSLHFISMVRSYLLKDK